MSFRTAFRRIGRNPGFAATVVVTVALGIGVNVTTFALLNALIFRRPPIPAAERLAYVYTVIPQATVWTQSPAQAKDIHDLNASFSSVAVLDWGNQSYVAPGLPPERIQTLAVSEDFFRLLEVRPFLGRPFTPEEDKAGGVAVISYRFWRSHLGADPTAVGRPVRIDGRSVTVVGVMPPSFDDPLSWGKIDAWEPLAFDPGTWAVRNGWWLKVLCRLKPGATLASAKADMDLLAARLRREHPIENKDIGLTMVPYLGTRAGTAGVRLSWLVVGLTLSVLLIASVNLANLQMARLAERARESAIRLALGSSRWRLVQQHLAETLVLVATGGVLGFAFAFWGTRYLGTRLVFTSTSAFAARTPGLALPLDLRVALFALAVAGITGAAFGAVPAFLASNTRPGEALKRGGRGTSSGPSHHRLSRALIIWEIALALGLLSGAAFLVRGTLSLTHRDLGWNREHLLVGDFDLPDSRYRDEAKKQATLATIRSRIAQIPGVLGASLSAGHPAENYSEGSDFVIEGRPPSSAERTPFVAYQKVAPGFLGTMGIRLLQGRDFTDADHYGSPNVIIVSEPLAKAFFPKGDAVGKRLGFGNPNKREWREIIGVVNRVTVPTQDFLGEGDFSGTMGQYQIYVSLAQVGSGSFTLSARVAGDPDAFREPVRRAIQEIDGDAAVYDLASANEKVDAVLANFSLAGRVLGAIAGLGALLAAVGVFGVIANLVVQRTHEIGIRMALGAETGDILWLVMRRGLVLSGIGVGLGLLVACGVTKVLLLEIPEIPGVDPATIAVLALLLSAAALAACWLPAQRAAAIDAANAIRAE